MRLLLFLACLPLVPAAAQTTAAPAPPPPATPSAPDEAYDPDEIVVRGAKPRGSVVGDITPEVTLSPADIRSYGVNSVSDLLNELAPQTGSDRGRGGGAPVVLLNGRRISGFGEIRDLPTEAIQRVEILPEEVSLKYGYAADQRVVNVVLRRRFRALVGQGGATTSTDGGGTSTAPEANLVRIHGDQRFSVNLRVQDQARLLETQRDLVSTATGLPYDLRGNVAAPRGWAGEIDPALSALAGRPVTIAGVPADTANPTLADFAATAGRANQTDVSPYRTLRSASRTYGTNLVYARPAFGRSTATLNGSLSWATTDGLQGLPGAALTLPAGNPFSPFGDAVGLYRYLDDQPLRQRTETLTAHVGLGLNGDRGHWRYSATGSFDRTGLRTRTETGRDATALQAALTAGDPATNPFAAVLGGLVGDTLVDRVRSTTTSGGLDAIAGGPVFALPAGSVGANLRAGFHDDRFAGDALRGGVRQVSDLGRRTTDGQINLDVPIASRKEDVLPALGQLSVNANLAVRQLSDFGTLRTLGYGLHWVPVTPIDLILSVTDDRGAPSVQHLGAPAVVTPQVRVFDYQAGTTVDVTQLSGGNRALRADDRRVVKLGLTLKPFAKHDLTVIANWLRTSTRNATATLPEPTADIQRAFPERFQRDAAGTLVRYDASPVNFARLQRNELRYGLHLSVSLKSVMQRRFEDWQAQRRAGHDVPPPFPLPDRLRRRAEAGGAPRDGADRASSPPGDAPPPSRGSGGFGAGPGGGDRGGGRGGFGRGQAGGRLQVAIYDTWTLKDTVLIRPGVPLIDLLNGGSVTSGGGQPDHRVELQLGYANNGLGVRLSGSYQTATTVFAGPGSAIGDLRFSALATADLRLFADLGQLPALVGKGWARGARVSLEVNNLANQRQRVRDGAGDTPLRYQPAYLDPLGRTVRITFRKLLF